MFQAEEVHNPFRYTGEYTDEETGYIYLRNRYYDPSIGRFTQEDPIQDGLNWYVYCSNNPVMLVDPMGLFDYNTILSYKQTYNQDVEVLQNELVWLGYMDRPADGDWGYFGPATLKAVNAYKQDAGLWNFGEYEGKVGLTTWKSLGLTYRTQEDIDAGVTIVMYGGRKQYKDVSNPLSKALNNITKEAEIINLESSIVIGIGHSVYSFAGKSAWFIAQVFHGQPWDIKREDPWNGTIASSTYPGSGVQVYYNGWIATPEELGNYTYGYIGHAVGYSLHMLNLGSWVAAGMPISGDDLTNEYNDRPAIQKGYNSYK